MISMATGSNPAYSISATASPAAAGSRRPRALFACFPQRNQSHGDLDRDAEQSLGTAEHPDPIRTDRLYGVASELDQLPVGQDRTNAKHVVAGHAVLQAVRASGIERQVSADRAHRLAGRIGA